MATPYKREGSSMYEAWNALIDEVNDILQNPPEGTDCEKIDELEHVGPDHKWSKTDIQEVQDKLKETCDSIDFANIPDLWKTSIIDEIKDAMDNDAWCDCKPACSCSCPNAVEPQGPATQYLATYDRYEEFLGTCNEPCYQDTCHCDSPVIPCPPDSRGLMDDPPCIDILVAAWEHNQAAYQATMFFCEASVNSFKHREKVEKLQEEIDRLQEKIDAQQEIVDDVCNAEPPQPNACQAAQDRLQELQDKKAQKEQERDAEQAEQEADEAEADYQYERSNTEGQAFYDTFQTAKGCGETNPDWFGWYIDDIKTAAAIDEWGHAVYTYENYLARKLWRADTQHWQDCRPGFATFFYDCEGNEPENLINCQGAHPYGFYSCDGQPVGGGAVHRWAKVWADIYYSYCPPIPPFPGREEHTSRCYCFHEGDPPLWDCSYVTMGFFICYPHKHEPFPPPDAQDPCPPDACPDG